MCLPTAPIILCFVDRAPLYNLVNRTNLVHNTQMNKIVCSNYFKTDTIRHTTPDILINTFASA